MRKTYEVIFSSGETYRAIGVNMMDAIKNILRATRKKSLESRIVKVTLVD